MYIIDTDDILIGEKIVSGYYGDIYRSLYGATEYALKLYKNPSMFFDKNMEDKLSDLSGLHLNHSLFPWALVKEEGNIIGYLSTLVDYRTFDFLENYSLSNKINMLTKAKGYLNELNNNDIIHADIHKGNILLRDELIIDFDNCFYKNFKPNFDLLSYSSKEFITKYGISKDLDVFSFNMMTYGLLNNIKTDDIETNISNNNFGVFTSKESIKICKSLLLEDKVFNNEFLIDHIDNSSIEEKNVYIKKMYK